MMSKKQEDRPQSVKLLREEIEQIKIKLEPLKNLLISMTQPQQTIKHLFLKFLETVVESGKQCVLWRDRLANNTIYLVNIH